MDKLIIAAISAIGGAICVYLGAVRIAQKNRRVESGFKLYDTFRHTINSLERAENFDTQDILKRDFGEQTRAAEHFGFFLPLRQRKAFTKAWNAYKQKYSENKFSDIGERDKRDSLRKFALNHIYNILKFTGYRQYTFREKIKILWNNIKLKIKKTAQQGVQGNRD